MENMFAHHMTLGPYVKISMVDVLTCLTHSREKMKGFQTEEEEESLSLKTWNRLFQTYYYQLKEFDGPEVAGEESSNYSWLNLVIVLNFLILPSSSLKKIEWWGKCVKVEVLWLLPLFCPFQLLISASYFSVSLSTSFSFRFSNAHFSL